LCGALFPRNWGAAAPLDEGTGAVPFAIDPDEMALTVIVSVELAQAARRRAATEEMNLSSALRRLLVIYAAGEAAVAEVTDPRVDRRLRRGAAA